MGAARMLRRSAKPETLAVHSVRAIACAQYRSDGRPRRRAPWEPPPSCTGLVWQPNCMWSGNSRKTHFGQGTNAVNRNLAARLHAERAGSWIRNWWWHGEKSRRASPAARRGCRAQARAQAEVV